MLLGPEARRRLELRSLSNEELFKKYDSEIALRLRNPQNMHDKHTMLQHFKDYIGEFPPTAQLTKSFLAHYSNHKPRTLYRYFMMIKPFMNLYTDELHKHSLHGGIMFGQRPIRLDFDDSD